MVAVAVSLVAELQKALKGPAEEKTLELVCPMLPSGVTGLEGSSQRSLGHCSMLGSVRPFFVHEAVRWHAMALDSP